MAQLINSNNFDGLTLSVVGSGGGSGIQQITSQDGSISITSNITPNGQIDDLSVNFPEPSGVQSIESKDNSITITSTNGVDNLSVNFPVSVENLNGLSGLITIVGTDDRILVDTDIGTNIITINSVGNPVTDRTSTVLITGPITATTPQTAQTIATLDLTTSYIANIDVSLSFTIQSNSNSKVDVAYIIFIAGIASSTFRNTINGINHYGSCSSGASRENVPSGTTTIQVKAYASSSGVITITPLQMRAIGNLLQG